MIGAINMEPAGYSLRTGRIPPDGQAPQAQTLPVPAESGGIADPYRTPIATDGQKRNGDTPRELWEKHRCRTCESRTYQDGSNDPGVSMKTPTKVAPQNAAAAVMGHEQQHVSRNAIKAESEGRKVISSTVRIHNAICSECGITYVAGGTTRTVTAAKQSGQEAQQKKQLDTRA